MGSHQANDQQRAHGEKGGRLDEHGGDGPVQSGSRPRSSANKSDVESEPDDDHEGEENVE